MVIARDSGNNFYVGVVPANNDYNDLDNKPAIDGVTLTSTTTKEDLGLATVFVYKGQKPTYADLPKTGNKVGDVWDVADTGNNYVWNGTSWDDLGCISQIKTLKQLGIPYTNVTTKSIAQAIVSKNQAPGTIIIGGVTLSDFPDSSLVNAELFVEVMDSTIQNITVLNMRLTSLSVAPYEWITGYRSDESSKDMVWLPMNIQYDTMPTATAYYLGKVIQYTGATTSNYTTGFFYKCVQNGETYSWTNINVNANATTDTYGLVKPDGSTITIDSTTKKLQASSLVNLTATTTELNVLDGITATTTELNYTDGVTSNIQTQLNGKQSEITSTNMLSSDLVTDTNKTHKFVTSDQMTTWTNKQDALTSGTNIKTINGTTILGSGDLTVKTYAAFPSDFVTSGTLQQVVTSMLSSSGAKQGMAYLGGISGACMPWGSGNAECKVEFMKDNIAVLTINSSNVPPYTWAYNSDAGDYTWRQNITQYKSMPASPYQAAGAIVQYIGDTTSDYTNGYFYKYSNNTWTQVNVQPAGAGTVTDVQVNGSTVLSGTVANIPYNQTMTITYSDGTTGTLTFNGSLT